MCSAGTTVGTEIFLQFNSLRNYNIPLSTHKTADCACEISAISCKDRVTLTLLKMPMLATGSNPVCSGMTVETSNRTYSCGGSVVNYDLIETGFPTEVVSLRNIPQTITSGEQVLIRAQCKYEI